MKPKNDFNYKNLIGEEFEKYCEHLDKSHPPNDFRSHGYNFSPIDFDLYPAQAVLESGKLNGIILLSEQPEKSARISADVARDYNQQIMSATSGRTGFYYLLKK